MQKLQDSVFSIVKTTNLSPAVFSYLQPSDENSDNTPLGGILSDCKLGWLALGPKFCVVDLRTGLKIAARTFGAALSNFRTTVTSVVELPTPLTDNSQQLLVSLECEDIAGMICVFHINGSQLLRCIQTEVVVTQLAVCDVVPDGPFSCFDGVVMAGCKSGEIFVFDLNRASLIQALKDLSQGYDQMVRGEENSANITFLPLHSVFQIDAQRDLALENEDHIAVLLNETSLIDGQYIFRNPDGTVRMKSKRDHIRVTVLQYIPQLASLSVGFNFGAFQLWNLLNLDLEFTSQVNVEILPVTHFAFQEPCDDPRAFCYLWVVFSMTERCDEEQFPLAVMYSLTYQGKRMLSDTKCLYQEFLTAVVRFQVELSSPVEDSGAVGGRCIAAHSYCLDPNMRDHGDDSMLNICQLVWECWGENGQAPLQYGMLLFDLDQWYKDQMPATYPLSSSPFMSAVIVPELRGRAALGIRLVPSSLSVYSAAARLEEHFYPNSLQYNCICLNTAESCVLSTIGIQRQIINSIDEVGPTALLNPTRLYNACLAAGLIPLYLDNYRTNNQEQQRSFVLSVALEARLSRFLKRCARDWAAGAHSGARADLPALVDWCWKRAIELKENARELTAPLFTSSALPDRNVVRCLEHCVQQLSQLTSLLDAVLTKCCNLVVPDALSEIEEKHKGIGCVSLYFQVVQWCVRCGLLPERADQPAALRYPVEELAEQYTKRRMKLGRLCDAPVEEAATRPCALLYIDQLIEHEFGGERVRQMWQRGGSNLGLYPPPSLRSLLRLYLQPAVSADHKHSLMLYLLVDYSMLYDELRYEEAIRRLMQFPTMFGLSNTAIKATQAFWHLDHRDFDFALDQLQCLTGNTLSEWQHSVVLSSLLAQKKTQAALQYLHVRKPAPIQNVKEDMNNTCKISDHDKLDDWQSCTNLYLARGLVYEALDVVRMCVQNAATGEDKAAVLDYFYDGCRNTGQLSKLLQATLMPFEEEIFIKYLEESNKPETSDILIMYYLQQARYLEAEQCNNKLKRYRSRTKNFSTSTESLSIADTVDRESARDTIVELVCSSLPAITNTVAHCALDSDLQTIVMAPKPMSVYVEATSPKNKFTYKSSFIQCTIENASETWVNKPKTRRGMKRALNIEDTPFICTPKLLKTKSIFSTTPPTTPPKRPRLSPRAHTPHNPPALSQQMALLLHMPDHCERTDERSMTGTPHSILKTRSSSALLRERELVSPVDSRYLGDSDDDEVLETASNHTHYSDSTNKHLRFTIPTASESGSTPSPLPSETARSVDRQKERDIDRFVTTTLTHSIDETNPLESPPKRLATEDSVRSRKTYKDTVRARHSLSANSSLSDDPNASIESIADIPMTLINPRYSNERPRISVSETEDTEMPQERRGAIVKPGTPKSRRGIRAVSGESTPVNRSRSRTPEVSPRLSPLPAIPEIQNEPKPEFSGTSVVVPRATSRSRSRTPERKERVLDSPRLEAITESPTKPETPVDSPTIRSLRSRSRTPEVEVQEKPTPGSPRSLRARAKTPEKLASPKKEVPKSAKKSLSRIVLEANAFAKTKQSDTITEPIIECTPMKALKPVSSLMDVTISPIMCKSVLQSSNESVGIETPKDKPNEGIDKSIPAFTLDEAKFGKSVLNSYESSAEVSRKDIETKAVSRFDMKSIPAFSLSESFVVGKSVLESYESSVAENSTQDNAETKEVSRSDMKSIPAFTLNESLMGKSVLQSYESSAAEDSTQENAEKEKKIELRQSPARMSINIPDFDKSVLGSCNSSARDKDNLSSIMTSDSEIDIKDDWKEKENTAAMIQKEKEKIVEIEREINEIEGGMSEDSDSNASSDGDDEMGEEEEESDQSGSSMEEDEEGDAEVISIQDTDSETSQSERLKIDEGTSSSSKETPTENVITTVDVTVEHNEADLGVEKVEDPLNPVQSISMMTDDNSVNSDLGEKLNYSGDGDDKGVGVGDKQVAMETDVETPESIQIDVRINVPSTSEDAAKIFNEKPTTSKEIAMEVVPNVDENIVKPSESSIKTGNKEEPKLKEVQPKAKVVEPKEKEVEPKVKEVLPKEKEVEPKLKEVEPKVKEVEPKVKEVESKEKEVESKAKEEEPKVKGVAPKIDEEKTSQETKAEKSTELKTMRGKRGQSASKDIQFETESITEEPKIPMTRKRSQSIASNKSVEEKTLEETTPSRRRVKTPTSEVRRILTRRASKELSEKLDESQSSLIDESILTTPKRRSTRSRSKLAEDSASIASESSIVSGRSVSEEAGDIKPAPVRKGRKSVLATKPDLSVIPENTVEESTIKNDNNSDIISEYSRARRLTRHQKSVLESWLEASPSAQRGPSVDTTLRDENVANVTQLDAQTMDRINLLNKGDFEGSPDPSEVQSTISPESIASDASKQRRQRAARAASESKSTPKTIRSTRRTSVDVESPIPGSPLGRGRRASFTKACEALLTPKGTRRVSADKHSETDSQGSPTTSDTTPARRPRRASNASVVSGNTDTSRRSKKN